MKWTTRIACIALLAGCTTNSARAGGYAMGAAELDILFDPGRFSWRAGVTYVVPHRKIDRGPQAGEDTAASFSYFSGAMKLTLFEGLSCAATVSQPYGGFTEASVPAANGTLDEILLITETALTCAPRFELDTGNVYLLAGVFQERLSYDLTRQLAPNALADVDLDGTAYGLRVGVAYDIPEIAFRTQLMYRSGTSYGAQGRLTAPGDLVGSTDPSVTVPAYGEGIVPQSIELQAQTGIAPGWLVFGSLLWQDWSRLEKFSIDSVLFSDTSIHNWRDGWTATFGVGHAFTEQASGLIALTYDHGTSTGWELGSGNTWIGTVGGSLKDAFGGELRGGLSAAYLAPLAETENGAANAAAAAGWAYGVNFSYNLSF